MTDAVKEDILGSVFFSAVLLEGSACTAYQKTISPPCGGPCRGTSWPERLGETPFTEADILSGSFSITGQCSESGNVQIGQVYIGELKATFLETAQLSRYTLKGAEVYPNFGLRLQSGVYEYVPLGVYTISEASWGASGVEVTAYDHMAKLDRTFSGNKLSGKPYTLLTLACESCGVELGMAEADFEAFPNSTATLQIHEENDCETWRDVVAWIAQSLAANVFADRSGKIVRRKYGRQAVDTVDDCHRLSSLTSSYVSRIVKSKEHIVNKTFIAMMEQLGYDVELTYVKRGDQ